MAVEVGAVGRVPESLRSLRAGLEAKVQQVVMPAQQPPAIQSVLLLALVRGVADSEGARVFQSWGNWVGTVLPMLVQGLLRQPSPFGTAAKCSALQVLAAAVRTKLPLMSVIQVSSFSHTFLLFIFLYHWQEGHLNSLFSITPPPPPGKSGVRNIV